MSTVAETGGRLGFITPMTHNFCESCNRVRLTCTGTLYMCLGQEDAADLRAPLRASEDDGLLSRRSTRRSPASRRATISSSTAATAAGRRAGPAT
jgi:cyclic pyranopterin phosphate synthase